MLDPSTKCIQMNSIYVGEDVSRSFEINKSVIYIYMCVNYIKNDTTEIHSSNMNIYTY